MLKNNNNNSNTSKGNINNNNIKIINNTNNNKRNSNAINKNNNNININNINNYNGTLYNEFTKDYNKSKANNSLFNKTFTVINIKKPFKNEEKKVIKNNLGEIITKFDTPNEPKTNRMFSNYNKKAGNQEQKPKNANNYNSNMNSLSQYIKTVNNKANVNNNVTTKKKSNSSNQKNSKFVIKQNLFSPSVINTKKDESKKIENMFINLNNYIPKNDINVDDRNFPNIKKKK